MLQRLLLTALVVLGLPPRPVAAQTVRGTVIDLQMGVPISWGYVALVDSTATVLVDVWADGAGRFTLTADEPGQFDIYGQRLGYLSTVSGPLDLGEGDTITVELTLSTSPIQLEGVSIETLARSRRLAEVGFYSRQHSTPGYFLEGDQLEVRARSANYLSELLRGIPRLRLSTGRIGAPAVTIRKPNFRSLECAPEAYVDGIRISNGWESWVRPDEVEAIEVYRGEAQGPMQFAGLNSGCGVILIWTQR